MADLTSFLEPLSALGIAIFGLPTSRLFIGYLLLTVILAYAIYWLSGAFRCSSFWRFLFPAGTYGHPSHITDIKLTILGFAIRVAGLFSFTGVATVAAAGAMAALGAATGLERAELSWSTGRFLALTLLFAVVADFCTYWVHRVHHEMPLLWPFHKVHHSAEVMTPITVYRKHPIYDLFSNCTKALAAGLVQGTLVYLLVGRVDLWVIAGANMVFVGFNILGSNLRHTHIWLDFGPVFDRILISPAQHQIHHSRDPRHFNTNYGEVFAVWDWMFGSLYLPRGREALEFGLADAEGHALPQPHDGLRAALLAPFSEAAAEIKTRRRRPM
jgi:sterol desaturase/sphingolipid hydroxylase (fatty acid hydroxylase superfamily)